VHSWQTRLIIFNAVGVLMLSDHLHSYDNQLIVSKKQILRISNVCYLKVTPRFCDLPTLLNGQTGAYSYQLSQKYTHSSCRFLDVHQLIIDFFLPPDSSVWCNCRLQGLLQRCRVHYQPRETRLPLLQTLLGQH